MMLAVMLQNAVSQTPSADDAAGWAEAYGIEHPVLADGTGETLGYVLGYPTFVVIDREMVIQNANMWPWSDNEVTKHL